MKGHIRERAKGVFAIVIDLGRDGTGKRRRKWTTVHGGKREAQRELARLLSELQAGTLAEPGRLTVRQFLERYLADARPNVSGKTHERYCEIVRRHLIPAFGHHQLAKLHPLHLQAYYTQALESGRKDGKGGLSAQTVVHHHRVLHRALGVAVRLQLVSRNVSDAVEPPRPAASDMACLDADGTARLLEAAEGTRLYLPLLLAGTGGLRLGEILGLRWEDVDLDTGALHVRQALEFTRAGIAFKQPKTHRSKRPVTLPALVVAALVRQRGLQAQQRLLLGPAYQTRDLVIAREDGSPMNPQAISKDFARLAERAGVPQVRFHDLRHTHAAWLLREGVPLKVVSERLGHAQASTTLDIYAHVLPGEQEEVARRVEEGFGAAIRRRQGA